MIYAVLLGLLLLIAFLFFLLRRQEDRLEKEKNGRGGKKARPGGPKVRPAEQLHSGKRCTVCGEYLEKGQSLRTTLYPPDGGEGRLMEIHGCPSCAPRGEQKGRSEAIKNRKCPLCGSRVAKDEVLICRRFEAPERNQVLVLGCAHCYKRNT